LIPGGHVLLRFGDARALAQAAGFLGAAARDEDALTLQVPGDAGVRFLRELLNRLDEHAIGVEGLSVHTPDLDDVFLALTGHPQTERADPGQGRPPAQEKSPR
jgi:ABC-2 type transport system ATP-binding protein